MTGPPWSSGSARGEGAGACGRGGPAVADAWSVCRAHDCGLGWGRAGAAEGSCEGSLRGLCRSRCENGGSSAWSRRGERGPVSAGRRPRGRFKSVDWRSRGRVQDMRIAPGTYLS